MRKLLASISLALALVVALPSAAFAHVVVTPDEALTGSRTTFSVSVPNEKEVPVTGLRLLIPSGVESATPTVKPGWTITTKADAKDAEKVTEVAWTGGSIPVGQRDDFTFRSKLGAEPADLIWKAYQTYADGTVAAWDQKPVEEGSAASHGAEESDKGPYSVTAVVASLDSEDDNTAAAATSNTAQSSSIAGIPTSELALGVSLAALILSVIAILKSGRAHTHADTAGTPSSTPDTQL